MGLAGFNRARLRHTIEGEESPSLSKVSNKPLHMIGYFTRECPICQRTFNSGRAVSGHMRVAHPDEQYKYEATAG